MFRDRFKPVFRDRIFTPIYKGNIPPPSEIVLASIEEDMKNPFRAFRAAGEISIQPQPRSPAARLIAIFRKLFTSIEGGAGT